MSSAEKVSPVTGVHRVVAPSWARLKFGLHVPTIEAITAALQMSPLPLDPQLTDVYAPKIDVFQNGFQLWVYAPRRPQRSDFEVLVPVAALVPAKTPSPEAPKAML